MGLHSIVSFRLTSRRQVLYGSIVPLLYPAYFWQERSIAPRGLSAWSYVASYLNSVEVYRLECSQISLTPNVSGDDRDLRRWEEEGDYTRRYTVTAITIPRQ